MKKLFYSFLVLSVVFSSCNVMDDIYEEIDAKERVIVGETSITLTDDDYTALGLNFGNFNSETEAKEKLPEFLAKKYPTWGNESLVSVTFKLYNPKRDEKSLAVYEVTDADYIAQGGNVARFGNFSSYDDIVAFLNTKYPSAANRLLVSLTYKYYNGAATVELNNGFINNSGTWEMSIGITDEEYAAMGEGRAQFSFEDEAYQKIPVFLNDRMKYENPQAGDIQGVMFKLYVTDTQDIDDDGRTDDRALYSYVAFFIYDGASWSKYNNVIDQTIKFGHDGDKWVPDNTIKYTLTNADYALVGNDRYNNFDVRAGKDEEKEEARIAKINTILLNNFPNDAEGQKYLVSYNIYNGANGVWTLAVIKENGAYVKQK